MGVLYIPGNKSVPNPSEYLGIGTGNPGVFQGYPYPYPRKPVPVFKGTGFVGYGYGFSQNPGVHQSMHG
jgi:hypothetical protein